MAHALSAIWERHRAEILVRVGVVEDAVLNGLTGQLDKEQRAGACHDAHKLAGSAGTFGFAAASEIARELERALDAPRAAPADQFPRLADLVVALRRELEAAPPATHATPATLPMPGMPAAPAPDTTADLLVVGAERERMCRLGP